MRNFKQNIPTILILNKTEYLGTPLWLNTCMLKQTKWTLTQQRDVEISPLGQLVGEAHMKRVACILSIDGDTS